jgi:tetratricopeptide (TPR) repeat protein
VSEKLSNSVQGSLQQPYQQVTVSYGSFDAAAGGVESAEMSYSRASALKEQMRLLESLAAFDRAIALKPDYPEAHNGRGIVLASLDRPAEAIAGFDRAIALRPDYAEAYNNRGLVLQRFKRLDEALASFDKALALQPENGRIHNNRGTTLHEANRFKEALASYDRAIALQADYAEAHYNRGVILQDLRRLDKALAAFDTAIALKPDYAAAYNNRGVVLQDFRRLSEALASFEKTIALSGGFPEVYVNQSHCLLLMGRFGDGWRLGEWRKRTVAPVGNRSFPQPLWLGKEDVANKTVFIHSEQGLGDTIQFCRYSKLLAKRGANVAMSVQSPLYSLLKSTSPDILVLREGVVPAAFDYHCPLMSLPFAFETTLETIPSEEAYIFADEQKSKAWDARLPPRTRPRIGIAWSGNPKHKNDRNRSIELTALAPLFSTDVQWVSLQKDLRPGESGLLRDLPQIVRYGEELTDFSDTAALIDNLDLIIAVDTSVAHLAGAMGKPVWILLPFNSDWRWLCDREDSPWYPSARLFRQDLLGSWDTAVGRLGISLSKFVLAALS